MFNYGEGYGTIKGIVQTLGIPLRLVPPSEWTKVLHKGVSRGTAKEKSKEAAGLLFPKEDFMRSPRCKKQDEGLIDAVLITEFGVREQSGRV